MLFLFLVVIVGVYGIMVEIFFKGLKDVRVVLIVFFVFLLILDMFLLERWVKEKLLNFGLDIVVLFVWFSVKLEILDVVVFVFLGVDVL